VGKETSTSFAADVYVGFSVHLHEKTIKFSLAEERSFKLMSKSA